MNAQREAEYDQLKRRLNYLACDFSTAASIKKGHRAFKIIKRINEHLYKSRKLALGKAA